MAIGRSLTPRAAYLSFPEPQNAAAVAELADALDSGSSVQKTWRFDSSRPHTQRPGRPSSGVLFCALPERARTPRPPAQDERRHGGDEQRQRCWFGHRGTQRRGGVVERRGQTLVEVGGE